MPRHTTAKHATCFAVRHSRRSRKARVRSSIADKVRARIATFHAFRYLLPARESHRFHSLRTDRQLGECCSPARQASLRSPIECGSRAARPQIRGEPYPLPHCHREHTLSDNPFKGRRVDPVGKQLARQLVVVSGALKGNLAIGAYG
jgi:hypothetical protein